MSDSEQQYAPPVSRDGFCRNGHLFYVEIGRHRHERLDPIALHALLTYIAPPPLLTGKGTLAKLQPPAHADPAGHFYHAQLAHYGFKPLTTKDAAEKFLLAAFDGTTTLIVPERILQLERVMKEEYRAANEAAKQKYNTEKVERALQRERKLRKRKLGQDVIMQEFLDAGMIIAVKIAALVPDDSASDSDDSSGDDEFLNPATRTDLLDAISGLSEEKLREIMTRLVQNMPPVEAAMRREVRKAAKEKISQNTREELGPQDFQAQYDIVAPHLSEQKPYPRTQPIQPALTIDLSPSSSRTPHLWGAFHLGVLSGILRFSSPPPTHVGDTCTFVWRGREAGRQNLIAVGDSNVGEVTFLGEGKIKGRMQGDLVTFEFVGRTRRDVQGPVGRGHGRGLEGGSGPVVAWSTSVEGWKERWKTLSEGQYDKERVQKWGELPGDVRARTIESDVSDGIYD